MWNAKTGKELKRHEIYTSWRRSVCALAFDRDGNQLALGTENGTIVIRLVSSLGVPERGPDICLLSPPIKFSRCYTIVKILFSRRLTVVQFEYSTREIAPCCTSYPDLWKSSSSVTSCTFIKISFTSDVLRKLSLCTLIPVKC